MQQKYFYFTIFIAIFLILPLPLQKTVGGPGPQGELAYAGIQWVWFSGLWYAQKFFYITIFSHFNSGRPTYFDNLTFDNFLMLLFISAIGTILTYLIRRHIVKPSVNSVK